VLGTLPGTSEDEVMIITTHTDGPNVVQENAGVGLVALARYFSRLPKSSRRRTLVFALTTGHDTGAYVPNTQGIVDRHPEMIKKTVASVAVEHLGCREWRDTPDLQYHATGNNELTYAMTNHKPLADVMLQSAQGTTERRVAAVAPLPPKGRYLGVGGALARTGMPTLGFYASPTYLNIVAPDGCISKLSQPLMYGQIQALAKVVHRIDEISASEIPWLPPTPGRTRE
jgi:ribosomal protein S12